MPVIKLLNQKGYATKYCCSEHHYNNAHSPNTYIAFDDDYTPNTIPKGFFIEDNEYYEKHYGIQKNNNQTAIRKYYKKDLNENKLHIEICKTMIDLMKWAEGLKEIE